MKIMLKSSSYLWDPDIYLYEGDIFSVRWYSVLFILGFIIGRFLVVGAYKREKKYDTTVDLQMLYMVFGILIGSRIGHVIFYEPEILSRGIIEVLSFWKGGLASHGAAIGIILGIIIFQFNYKLKSTLWIFDKLTVPVTLGGVFIRLGNFINSEILGTYTNSNFGVIFENRGEILPRHPAQLYESFGYLILFLILRRIYPKTNHIQGYLLGVFLAGIFSIRFLIEYVKESQGGFEEIIPFLSTGQWLSIPLIISGLIIILLAKSKKEVV